MKHALLLYASGLLGSEQGAPRRTAKEAKESAGDVLRGVEKPEDKHGAVTRLPDKELVSNGTVYCAPFRTFLRPL